LFARIKRSLIGNVVGKSKHAIEAPRQLLETVMSSKNRAVIEVREIDNAAIAADLFRRKFAQEIPDFPKHFVAMVGEQCAGYVHYTPWQGDYLCGGLCIDDRVHRSLEISQRAWIREKGGIAEIMMRDAHAALDTHAIVWGYIGDKQSSVVTQRVGFELAAPPYLHAVWRRAMSDKERQERIAEALAIGPF
jgi:hypothetical protein